MRSAHAGDVIRCHPRLSVPSKASTPSDNTWSFFRKFEASNSRTASSPPKLRQSESSSELSTQASVQVPGAEVIVLRRLYTPGWGRCSPDGLRDFFFGMSTAFPVQNSPKFIVSVQALASEDDKCSVNGLRWQQKRWVTLSSPIHSPFPMLWAQGHELRLLPYVLRWEGAHCERSAPRVYARTSLSILTTFFSHRKDTICMFAKIY